VDEEAIKQIHQTSRKCPNIFQASGMPDLHPGSTFPIGISFLSHDNVIYPALVGNDIGCGMCLYQTPLSSSSIRPESVKKQLTGMVETAKSKYSHIIFCRPDVLYHVPFQVEWLRFDSEKIFIPNFGLCANMNDRFAVGQMKQMIQYGSRFDEALAYSKKEPLASEAFLIATMKRYKLDYEHVNFYFTRIRANGEKDKMDLGQIRKLTRRKRPLKKGTRKHFKGHIEISSL
jgi:hypothetical protein